MRSLRSPLLCTLCLGLFLLLTMVMVNAEEKITWTANEDSEPALPQSMNQRQQLLQLQQAIESASDPNAVLQQVAEANNMAPQDLVNMLNKNARDLQQGSSAGGMSVSSATSSLVTSLTKIVGSITVMISQAAKTNPKAFSLFMTCLLITMYSTIMIPRTGLHVSTCTTLFPPSPNYLHQLANAPRLENTPVSAQIGPLSPQKWSGLRLEEDGTVFHKLPRSSDLKQAVSARVSIDVEDLMDDNGDDESVTDNVMENLFQSAVDVLESRKLTEFPNTDKSSNNLAMQSAVSSRRRHGLLVVPGLGTLGRNGLVHWKVGNQQQSEKEASITLSTLKGMGLFDGQIHCSVRRKKGRLLILDVHVAVPKKGKRISKNIATAMVTTVAMSLAESMTVRTQQALARQSQGSAFSKRSHQRANERRKIRVTREREMEAMAQSRRRKWQRKEAGRYRPTGNRGAPGGGPAFSS